MKANDLPGMTGWPRYCRKAFPAYRFLPGRTPHPRRNPHGHAFGQPEPRPLPFEPANWASSEAYLYGVDLCNGTYWWESHEVFEGLWHACGHKTEAGNFFQALIQFAGAHLKHALDKTAAAQNLARSGLLRLKNSPPHYMGLDTVAFADRVDVWLSQGHQSCLLIRLDGPGTIVDRLEAEEEENPDGPAPQW